MTPTTTYPERPDRAIVNPGHLATIDGHAAYIQDGVTDQIEDAMSHLASAKAWERQNFDAWRDEVKAAIDVLETLLDLTGGKETAGKDEE